MRIHLHQNAAKFANKLLEIQVKMNELTFKHLTVTTRKFATSILIWLLYLFVKCQNFGLDAVVPVVAGVSYKDLNSAKS